MTKLVVAFRNFANAPKNDPLRTKIKIKSYVEFLVTNKECQIPEQLRRYLNGNPKPKDHKEDPSTDRRITSNRIFAK